jgi:hypothetical protein
MIFTIQHTIELVSSIYFVKPFGLIFNYILNRKQDFEIKDTYFKTIDSIKKQVDQLVYLSDEEFALKKQIVDSIRTFFQMYEQFTLNKRIDDTSNENDR